MKYNARYRKYSTVIGLSPQMYDDPTPMTVSGTRAMVDRFYALKSLGVGAGGAAVDGGLTSPILLPPPKTESDFSVV